jgi:AraC-like DNA-binding protein
MAGSATNQGNTVAEARRIDETDAYTAAVKGATVEALRIGAGVGPNVVLGLPRDRVTVTSSRVWFPMCTQSNIEEGHVLVAFIERVEAESRWCGLPLEPGLVVVYGPGAEHVAVNQPGLHFTFAITETDRLEELADHHEQALGLPSHAGMMTLGDGHRTRRLGSALIGHTQAARSGAELGRSDDRVLLAMTGVLADGAAQERTGTGRGLDSRKIVLGCLDFAEAKDRIPSVEELCRAVHVSERRLRSAFTEEFDRPPSQYMRAWALGRAHRRLRGADPDAVTVTEVAAGLGFNHLGRFSGQYRRLFGESPSSTLREPGRARIA